ncbi:MAG: phosphate ABC transporter substrate-binding protein [Bacillota bacterium]|nr:phosphate ABC transporter substrate-binding protein [Bacillota bacterium]
MKRFLGILSAALIAVSLFSGCSNSKDGTSQQDTNTQSETGSTGGAAALSGSINLGGSTSVENVIVAAIDEFTAQNPDVTGKYDATGSSVGVTNAIDGTYHLGFSSRELKSEEASSGLTQKKFALDGIAVAVNPQNKVSDLTIAQIKDIFTGKITNWKDVGGEDAKIVVVSREAGSGTRDAFEELVGFKGGLLNGAAIKDGNGNVATYIGGEKNAIGYVSFVTLDENKTLIRGLKVEGADPTTDNVLNGKYKISRPFIMVYKEANLNGAEKAFADFLMSDDGQQIVKEKGAISVK